MAIQIQFPIGSGTLIGKCQKILVTLASRPKGVKKSEYLAVVEKKVGEGHNAVALNILEGGKRWGHFYYLADGVTLKYRTPEQWVSGIDS